MLVFPMAGKGQRFIDEGYNTKKYALPLWKQTVLHWELNPFAQNNNEKIIFIGLEDLDEAYLAQECLLLGLRDYEIIKLDRPTKGQAETVYLGTLNYDAEMERLYIFNIDTVLNDFSYVSESDDTDGYIDVTTANGDHWSFAKIDQRDRVLEVTEKVRISEWCSNGLYYFKKLSLFRESYLKTVKEKKTVNGEYYIAPLFNELISAGCVVKVRKIPHSNMVSCGTPSEYINAKMFRSVE